MNEAGTELEKQLLHCWGALWNIKAQSQPGPAAELCSRLHRLSAVAFYKSCSAAALCILQQGSTAGVCSCLHLRSAVASYNHLLRCNHGLQPSSAALGMCCCILRPSAAALCSFICGWTLQMHLSLLCSRGLQPTSAVAFCSHAQQLPAVTLWNHILKPHIFWSKCLRLRSADTCSITTANVCGCALQPPALRLNSS